jgi:putative addiction module component (TIGR02574 family)
MDAQIHDAALGLPDAERAELAYKLLQSLKPPGGISADSPDFDAELQRRADAYETGKTMADDWDTASARLRQALDDRKPS